MPSSRIMVTGSTGMLGSEVLRVAPPGKLAVGVDRFDFDLADADALDDFLRRAESWDGVIHCAGYTAVDGAEDEPEEAQRNNVLATEELAAACARRELPLVVVSTDFVFDGETERPYTEDDPTGPINVYGRTKLGAERAAIELYGENVRIVRTQWLYGLRGRHFPGRMLELARESDELRVVNDQFGSPTSTHALAPALWDVLLKGKPGIYHAACEGVCTWYELAVETLRIAEVEGVKVTPIPGDEYPTTARRPRYSVLDSSKLAELRGKSLPLWRDALVGYLSAQS